MASTSTKLRSRTCCGCPRRMSTSSPSPRRSRRASTSTSASGRACCARATWSSPWWTTATESTVYGPRRCQPRTWPRRRQALCCPRRPRCSGTGASDTWATTTWPSCSGTTWSAASTSTQTSSRRLLKFRASRVSCPSSTRRLTQRPSPTPRRRWSCCMWTCAGLCKSLRQAGTSTWPRTWTTTPSSPSCSQSQASPRWRH